MPMREEPLLEPADVARLLGVTPDAIRLLVRNQQIRVYAKTLRGGSLFRAADVELTRLARLAAKKARQGKGPRPAA
jgi:hypothetical protein